MKVFKFGGASINSTERFKNTAQIIQSCSDQQLLIVISAMGKTTNALEAVIDAFYHHKKEEALQLFEQIKNNHLEIVKYLLVTQWKAAEDQLKEFFTEIEWLLHDKPVRNYDYYYDQIICCGELFSSCILYHYLTEQKTAAHWIDVRDIIRTDNNFRNATINWEFTNKRILKSVSPILSTKKIVITQGFIGATDENESTTLGREGSDYTAAIFANLLNADSVSIWKDVEAVMSADPKKYPNASVIQSLSYSEVIEMAYYGAQVIHPKTIKPLQNKNIPLLVKSFLNPDLPGTTISKAPNKNLPPIIVSKSKQVLIQFKSKDFSFIEEQPMQQLHDCFNIVKIKPNLSQHTAISLLCCFDDHAEKIEQLAMMAAEIFDVEIERNLNLLTIRHYNHQTIDELTTGKHILVEQKTTETIQVVMR